MTIRVNDPQDLTKINKNLRYVTQLSNSTSSQPIKSKASISVASQPRLYVPKDVRSAYLINNWVKLHILQEKASQDLAAVYDHITKHQTTAWITVEDMTTNSKFNMIWDSNGNYVWASCRGITYVTDPIDPQVHFVAPVTYGVFSKSTNICGVHAYSLSSATEITELVCAGIFSFFVGKLIAKGINFLADDIIAFLADSALELGFELVFSSVVAVSAVCCVAVFAIVFIGTVFLFNFLNKRFQISVSVYNWDTQVNWQVRNQSLTNAVNPGKPEKLDLNLDINKVSPAGSVVPIGNVNIPDAILEQVIRTCEDSFSYAFICYENVKTFAQGLSFSFQCTRNYDQKVGFTYAFECPWTASNAQYMEGTVQDPKAFLEKANKNWVKKTGPFTTSVSNDGSTIKAYFDMLQGGDQDGKDCYKVAVHINPPAQ
ncbi:hypothetical protein CYY_008316 [Polysphondylium violaceum]|uniref:Uncharacterized protein n=1 Tax=Polysphondylium violaceum TaxID=133409 RepID=A0A8J4PLU5_9MYCE|nr:hypothetical protein CYY_008316 [Polysphondylium violaceum]